MAEEMKETQDTAAEETRAGMTGKKKLIIIGGIFVAQLILVLVLGQFLIKPRLLGADTTAVAVSAPEQRGTITTLDDITVNLNSDRRSRFLRVKIGLESEEAAVMAELEERKPEIRDLVITSVSGRTVDQLITVEGKEQLKAELKERINSKLHKGELINVFFSDFVVQ